MKLGFLVVHWVSQIQLAGKTRPGSVTNSELTYANLDFKIISFIPIFISHSLCKCSWGLSFWEGNERGIPHWSMLSTLGKLKSEYSSEWGWKLNW